MPNRPLPRCSPPTLRPHHSPRLRGGPTIPMHSPSRLRMSSYKSPPSRPFFLANPSPCHTSATVLLSLPHVYFSPRGMKSASMHPSPPTFGFKIVLPPLLVTWWGTGPRLAVTGRAPHVMVVCLFVYDVFAGPFRWSDAHIPVVFVRASGRLSTGKATDVYPSLLSAWFTHAFASETLCPLPPPLRQLSAYRYFQLPLIFHSHGFAFFLPPLSPSVFLPPLHVCRRSLTCVLSPPAPTIL